MYHKKIKISRGRKKNVKHDKELGFDAKHQYSSPCRRSASYRLSAAGMRTRFANRVCELVEPCFRQNEKDTTRVSFLVKQQGFDAMHQYSSHCRRSASYRRSAAGMRTRFTHEVRELVQAQCCFHRKKKSRTFVWDVWWTQLGSNQ